jgi:hypothetical protein
MCKGRVRGTIVAAQAADAAPIVGPGADLAELTGDRSATRAAGSPRRRLVDRSFR